MKKQKAKVISIYYQKGGVGKTTLAVNLAGCLCVQKPSKYSRRNNRILLIDCDSQASLSKWFNCYDVNSDKTTFDILKGNKTIKEARRHFEYEYGCYGKRCLDVVPSTENISGISDLRQSLDNPDERLYIALNDVIYEYDYIILDCPSQNDFLFENIFNVTDYFVLSTEADIIAFERLAHTYRAIDKLTTKQDKEAGKILGVCVYKYKPKMIVEPEKGLRQEHILRAYEENLYVFKQKIPDTTESINRAFFHRKPIVFYYKETKKCRNIYYVFLQITKEVLERMKEFEA